MFTLIFHLPTSNKHLGVLFIEPIFKGCRYIFFVNWIKKLYNLWSENKYLWNYKINNPKLKKSIQSHRHTYMHKFKIQNFSSTENFYTNYYEDIYSFTYFS